VTVSRRSPSPTTGSCSASSSSTGRRKRGINPILGSELYQAIGSRHDQQSGGADGKQRAHHLTVLAEDDTGYRNLMALSSSRAYLEGYWYKPRIDMELLEHHEGLIVLSGCLGSEVNQHLLRGDEEAARAAMATSATCSVRTATSSSCRTMASPSSGACGRCSSGWPPTSGCAPSSPTTRTTRARTTSPRTTRCCASRPARS
jgi:hypothetical protein